MKINGIVTRVVANGYDRLLTIETNGQSVWCSYFESSEYLEPGERSKFLKSGMSVCFRVTLKLVLKSKLVSDKICQGMAQNIPDSPHLAAIGRIDERLELDAYSLSVNAADSIEVQFEQNVEFDLGDYISVEGELVAEDDIDE
jgi:hypothetical protein